METTDTKLTLSEIEAISKRRNAVTIGRCQAFAETATNAQLENFVANAAQDIDTLLSDNERLTARVRELEAELAMELDYSGNFA